MKSFNWLDCIPPFLYTHAARESHKVQVDSIFGVRRSRRVGYRRVVYHRVGYRRVVYRRVLRVAVPTLFFLGWGWYGYRQC